MRVNTHPRDLGICSVLRLACGAVPGNRQRRMLSSSGWESKERVNEELSTPARGRRCPLLSVSQSSLSTAEWKPLKPEAAVPPWTLTVPKCHGRDYDPLRVPSPGRGPLGNSTPVFLPGESHGQRSLVGYSPQGRTELDMTKAT